MKKVEVYFLINLGAILSLFAIEGELARYMSRQDDILKNVAQDKLQDLVEISNVESNYEDPDYFRLFFIPIIPVGKKSQPFVECQHCKNNWHTSVLDQNNYYLDGTPVIK